VFKHIVVGCDGSPQGRDAVALGAAIASVTGARLSLVGVFPTSLFPITGVTDRKTLRSEATRRLQRDRDHLAPGAFIRPVADSSVPRALRHYAERWHADLVVIGSSPSAAPGHVSIGRRGRQLLYDAPFALALAARGLHVRGPQLQTVGVGDDGGPEAQAALALGAQLARAGGSRLLVRRVVEDRAPALTPEQWIALEDWNHSDVWADARQTALVETEAACSNLGVHADVSATVGDPGYELRALSDTVDLVVVGSRRWGPVARLVSGGVGETLVTDTSCSILIVPRPAVRRGRRADQRHRRRPIAA
jgi:nucleotide-binding universal stress UspA family protein